MGAKIGWLLLLVVIFGIVLYIYNSGVIGRGFSFLNSLGSRTSTPPVYVYTPPSTGGTAGGSTGGTVIQPPPSGSSTSSPYRGEVRLGSVYAGGGGSYGEITLYASLPNASATVDVTGWLIKTNRGGLYVPQAVNVYDPLGLAPETDIRMQNNDSLYLYSTSAPVNLRLNECIGYLPNKTQFNPQLPQNCPYTYDRAAIQNFTGACQNYIETLGSCQEPNMASPQIPVNDYSCIQYLENNFNYKSCFEQHQSDPNFLSNQIWAWVGSTPLDQFHDNVTLLDRNGLVVDTYSY